MKCRQFTAKDQIAFAQLSGDYNPLHIDAVASRRLIFGSPVVHGIHALLWSLDCLLEEKKEHLELSSIKAVFPRPIRVGEDISFSFQDQDDSNIRIELSTGQSITTIITVKLAQSVKQKFDYLKPGFPKKLSPRDLTENEIETDSSSLELYLNTEVANKLFPHLNRLFSPLQIAVILATTRVVGTMSPGLHSIYSEITLNRIKPNTNTTMDYKVTKLDRRVGLVLMEIVSPGMIGTIKAFRRPAPLQQENYLSLKDKVADNEFANQRALIIGGSRGLGEVVAKLLAGGGADVKITYHQGKEDALKIVEDIALNGGIASSCQYDVLNPEKSFSNVLLNDWVPTHLYYFATPFISSGNKGAFSSQVFTKFCDYYILGFNKTVNQLINTGARNIFYPSTVFIDELPTNMGEYVVSKMASETLCNFLEKSNKNLTIYKPRLPRVATDQTASIIPLNNQNPVPLMIKELRSFEQLSKKC